MNYKPVMGLEVHVELKTKSKMFCGCSADYFGQKPNTRTCPVCLGLPGALPIPNKKAIEWCVMVGQALNCKINKFSKFDRKNYFYPDLAKGYQISQYDKPFCQKGFITLSTGKKIGITRVHMEEDTGKLIHQGDSTLIDFNRSGVPLVEIVTDPDFKSASEVVEYLKKLQQIIRYLDVSDADMEKGNMRLEPNISLRKEGMTELPNYKVEVKNINSFKFVDKSIEYEIKRQEEILNDGKTPVQETRGWDEDKQKTVSQRIKEEANDYRYFPEPDIPPIRLSEETVNKLKLEVEMKEQKSPEKKIPIFINMGMSAGSAATIAASDIKFSVFGTAINQGTVSENQFGNFGNFVANTPIKPTPENLVPVLTKKLSEEFKNKTKTLLIERGELQEIINKTIKENIKAVDDYKTGKVQVIGFLIGKVKQHFPTADTNQIKTALEKQLK
ncbi:MAG: Asp-tRNA(Asn)/Glu-tRNA(Gln) amidotransferase subunit GatB [Candidatus Parcubacteria bacterium]|nr:Asp-tRNA(Asn)/Glu-tRNA(Gln) amidotransferase subunit GatB [Candidatus Parcubacteria bacterium]